MHRYRYCTVHKSPSSPVFFSTLSLLSVSLVLSSSLSRRRTHATHAQSGGNDDKDKGKAPRSRRMNRTTTYKVRSQLSQRGRCGTLCMQSTETWFNSIQLDSTHLQLANGSLVVVVAKDVFVPQARRLYVRDASFSLTFLLLFLILSSL